MELTDERLVAGRYLLDNGARAQQSGHTEDARGYFEAALLQFRGPELRLGEAHALRGLGVAALHDGELARAEDLASAAATSYAELAALLAALDAAEYSREAHAGESLSLTLLADVQARLGQLDQAELTLDAAGQRVEEGSREEGLVHLAQGRLALRTGRYDDSDASLRRAEVILEPLRESASIIDVLRARSELARLRGDQRAARLAADEALHRAVNLGDDTAVARSLASLGSISLQRRRFREALDYFEEALPLARLSGDLQLVSFALQGLSEAESHLDTGRPRDHLLESTHILGTLDNTQGLGTALIRIAERALRSDAPCAALLASEVARRLMATTDPVVGQRKALGVMIKALASLRQAEGVVLVAVAREAVAGAVRSEARGGGEFYTSCAPADQVRRLRALEPAVLMERVEAHVTTVLAPQLDRHSLSPEVLGTTEGALHAVFLLLIALPDPSDSRGEGLFPTGPRC